MQRSNNARKSEVTRRSLLLGVGGAAALASWSQTSASAATSTLWEVADWEALYRAQWIDNGWRTSSINRSLSDDSYQFYGLSYAIDGAVSMAEATGSVEYLDTALTLTENAISTATISSSLPDTRFTDGYLGWVGQRPEAPDKQIPLDESICWRYVTRLLRVIRYTPAWYTDLAIRARFDAILNFSETHIFEKWWTRGPNTNIYRSHTHLASHWAFIGLNLSLVTQSTSKKTLYESVVTAIDTDLPNYNSSLRQQMITHPAEPNAYFWNWAWGSTAIPGSDVSHGSHVISYCVESVEFGAEWNTADMAKFVALFDNVLWPSAGVYAGYLDGSSGVDSETRANDGWAKLGRFDAALQQRLQDGHGPSIVSGLYSCQYYATGALNASILL